MNIKKYKKYRPSIIKLNNEYKSLLKFKEKLDLELKEEINKKLCNILKDSCAKNMGIKNINKKPQ